jgi:tetratricopeptide (TPR) repeat protein
VRRAEPNSLRAVDFEEANLVRGLRLAEAQAAWAFARDIAWTLAAFYKARGRSAEWAALRASLLRRLGRDLPEGTDRDQAKANLWVFLLGNEANAAVEHNELAAAEAAHLRVLDYLLAHQDSAAEHDIAWTYLRLGVVAMSRRQYDRAEAWCQKALAIYERPGQEHNGEIYFQLGRLALERGQHDRAEEWYRKALAIGERLGLEWNAAATCHSLGVVAWSRGQHDQAQEWYQKALAIHERLGLEAEAAADYHTLGKVEQLRGRYDQAEEWYRKALAIRERLGLELRAAHDYQELGVVARWRGQYVRAAEWYRKALATYERLGHPSWQVEALEVLGQLCRDQNQVEEAISWLGQALIIATAHDMRVAGRIIAELGGLVDRVGEQCFSATWKQTFPDHATLLERLCTAAHESSSPPAQAG